MPKRNVAVISHSALTNHRIPARPDKPLPRQASAADGGLILVNPRPDAKQSLSEITLLRAYSELAARDAEYQQRYLKLLDHLSHVQPKEPFVQAALGHKALTEGKSQDALAHLSNALSLGDTTVYRDIAQALVNLGRSDDALQYLRQAAAMEPFNATVQKTLILEYINLKQYADARKAMQQYVSTFPEDSFMRGLLARVGN
jgi:Flp pilus assembly protein TadD